MAQTLAREDFSDFPIGPIPIDNTATGEYHYRAPDGHIGQWYPSVNRAEWTVVEHEGRHRILATRTRGVHGDRAKAPTLVTGDPLWADYTAETRVQPLRPDGFVGLAFRYESSRAYYRLQLEEGKAQLLYVSHGTEEELAATEFDYSCDETYALRVSVEGDKIQAFVERELILEATDDRYKTGRVALVAAVPALFDSLHVSASHAAHEAFVHTRERTQRELDDLRERYPKPVVWKKIDTRGFGAGRQIRFGHLTSNDRLDFVLAQNMKLAGNNFQTIQCLTAMDLDGDILWQFGEPVDAEDAGMITSDVAFQIYDIDGDGRDEVLGIKNFRLYVLDGQTGEVKASMPTPVAPHGERAGSLDETVFHRISGDSILIANFRGLERPSDIVIKDRYNTVWAYDNEFNLLWSVRCNTGHFAQPYDFDGDGRDELYVGYTLIGPDGEVRWSKDWDDHTDEIVIGAFNPERDDVQIGIACGDEGFNILSPTGETLYREMLGHAQRLSAARYRDDLPGLQYYVVTYWGNPGIISFHDCTGQKLFSFEPAATGSIASPVNWTGNGVELSLLSGSIEHGGMVDGHGRRVVVFPDDGHPDLAAEVLDLTGDARDEIVLWDMERVWIYTQDRPFDGDRIYRPMRFPHYNASNYRGEISLPGCDDE